METLRLAGKVALVTGGSRRIGRAIALRLAEDGASVAVNARSSRAEAESVVHEIEQAGGRAEVVMADVTDPAQNGAMVERTVERFRRLDIVVHNAVMREHRKLDEIGIDEWRAALAVVLDGGFLTAKHAAPHLGKQGGAIVMIGGASAFVGSSGPATPTAKAGLVGLVRSLAVSLGPKGITANLVSPGRIEDDEDEEGRRARVAGARPVDTIPLRRPGRPTDVAGTVAALASDDMRYVTGQTIHVTGGFYMG